MMRYEKASQNKEMQASPGSNVAQLEQTANSRLKMMQPRTTGPYHKSFQTFLFFFFLFFQSCWLEVSDIFWPSYSFPSGATGAVSFSSPAWGAPKYS